MMSLRHWYIYNSRSDIIVTIVKFCVIWYFSPRRSAVFHVIYLVCVAPWVGQDSIVVEYKWHDFLFRVRTVHQRMHLMYTVAIRTYWFTPLHTKHTYKLPHTLQTAQRWTQRWTAIPYWDGFTSSRPKIVEMWCADYHCAWNEERYTGNCWGVLESGTLGLETL